MSLRKVPNLEDFQFQPSVKDKDLSSPPGGLSKGDRYIVAATGSGNWAGQIGNIAIYNGSTWDFVTKREGMVLWVEDENLYYKYDGSNWTIGTTDISSLTEKTSIIDNDLLIIEDSAASNLKKRIKKSTLFGNFTETKLSQIINNIFLAFFKISVLGGLSKYNLVDGIMDEFEDETGVATKTNASYNSTDDYYSPSINISESIDQQEINPPYEIDIGDWNNTEYRPGQSFQLSSTLTVTAVEIKQLTSSGSPTGNWTIRIETNNAGLPSGILANVNASVVVVPPGNGNTVKGTFATSFSLVGSTIYWIVIQCDNQSTSKYWGLYADYNCTTYTRGAAVVSINGTWTAWNSNGNGDIWFKVYVEIISGYNNMTLISNATAAEATPAKSRIVLFEEDVDAVTINTDLKAYVSRDGGTTYTQLTLVDEGDYDTSKRILSTEAIDISGQPSGTSMKWKVETLNNKNLKLHCVGVNWDA